MIAYPAELPCPNLSGYSEIVAANMIKSQFAYGAEQSYIAQDVNIFKFSIVIPHSDLKTFTDFFESLYDGVAPFSTTWTVFKETNVTSRFVGPYSISNLGGLNIQISATMEVL